jgi:hypothetical protein
MLHAEFSVAYSLTLKMMRHNTAKRWLTSNWLHGVISFEYWTLHGFYSLQFSESYLEIIGRSIWTGSGPAKVSVQNTRRYTSVPHQRFELTISVFEW